jgi:hypothetical protein
LRKGVVIGRGRLRWSFLACVPALLSIVFVTSSSSAQQAMSPSKEGVVQPFHYPSDTLDHQLALIDTSRVENGRIPGKQKLMIGDPVLQQRVEIDLIVCVLRFSEYLKKIRSRAAQSYCTVRTTLAIAVVVPEVPVTVIM